MARPTSSRTSTAEWKKIRDKRREEEYNKGLTNCPSCGVWLNWDQGLLPNSAEVDHIEPWVDTRTNDYNSTQIICRLCNQKKGGKQGSRRKQKKSIPSVKFDTVLQW